MKKGKLLILLVAILSFILLLAACDKTTTPETTSTDTESASASETASENTQEEASTEAHEVKHEAHDYFVLEEDKELSDYKDVSLIDGKYDSHVAYANLLLVTEEEIDVKNDLTKSVIVYDAASGEQIHRFSVTYPLYAEDKDVITLEVEVYYPVIQVSKMSYGEDGFEDYDISYYLAKKDGALIKNTTIDNFECTEFDNGLTRYVMGNSTVWIDKNMSIVNTADVVVSGNYEFGNFNSEYMGYLYSWDDFQIQIFNRSGFCSGVYSIDHDGMISAHVLNDGNVVIQELEPVDEYTDCDIVLMDIRFVVKSYVMNYVDGSMKEIELDFLIDDLCSKYGEESNYSFPFRLAQGRENQAYVYRFANGTVSPYVEYVVMNNDLEIEYTLNNGMHGVSYKYAYTTDNYHYVAHAPLANVEQAYLFDLDGNAVPISEDGTQIVSSKYIVTEQGLFNMDLYKVYDFDYNGIDSYSVDYWSGRIYMSKYNFLTGGVEFYIFDGSTNKEIMITDGLDTVIYDSNTSYWIDGLGWGYYIIQDRKANVYTLFNLDGESILVTYSPMRVYEMDNMLIVLVEFEGETLVYTLK